MKLRSYNITYGDTVPCALPRCVLALVSYGKEVYVLILSESSLLRWLAVGSARTRENKQESREGRGVVEGFSVTLENLGR